MNISTVLKEGCVMNGTIYPDSLWVSRNRFIIKGLSFQGGDKRQIYKNYLKR